MMFISDMYGTI